MNASMFLYENAELDLESKLNSEKEQYFVFDIKDDNNCITLFLKEDHLVKIRDLINENIEE